MRVAIDARELCGHPTGVGRYLSRLLTAWAVSDRARRHDLTLIAHAPIAAEPGWRVTTSIVPGGGGTAWEQMTLPGAVAAARADLLFAPGYTAPLTVTTPLVLTIHDVSYFAHPEWFSFREGTRRRMLTAWSARRARKVITVSNFSKTEIERFIGIKDVRAIPHGIDRIEGRPDVLPGTSSTDRSMILYVGSVFERRRVDRLIASFDQIVARVPNATLEIVGENRTRGVDLDALRLRSKHADRIFLRSYVDEATLEQLYRDASVLAFLSEYEGFGFTPLEAVTRGVPPVVLDTPIARETYGEAAIYVPPSASNDEIAAIIANLITNNDTRRAALSHAGGVLARYDWTRAAEDTLSVLEEAVLGR
ncbi:MAG TPA: glycosyltransferase family 1 protein [Vicinamibacterales bacterium]|nr:glycosyltransferase family 1 protein [Vicinamibacterales bacterium]